MPLVLRLLSESPPRPPRLCRSRPGGVSESGEGREEKAVDPQKLVKSLEGAVFELALWVLLLPKTLLRVLRHPVWVLDYTTAEFLKPEAERFDDYVSPVSFWLLVAVGPYLWATSVVRHRHSPPGAASGDVLSHLPISSRYLITALVLVAAPLTVAVIFSRIRGHSLA